MKKKNLLALSIIFGVSACSEKDQNYYLTHIDDAKNKMEQCQADLKLALKEKDENKFKLLTSEQSECAIVDKALREHRRLERETQERERKAKEEAEVAKIKTEILQEYGQQSWQDFSKSLIASGCKSYSYDTKCKAMFLLYDEKIKPAILEMKAKGLENLLADKQLYCKQDQRTYSTCDVWKKAVSEQSKEEFNQKSLGELDRIKETYCKNVDYRFPESCNAWENVYKDKSKAFSQLLSQDYDKLKDIYNACIVQIKGSKNWDKRNMLSNTYPCYQASDARVLLQLPYDNFETKMD